MPKRTKPKKRRRPDLSNPNSKTWLIKADDLWADVIKQVGECEVCGTEGTQRKKDGAMVVGLQAHHLILRGRHKYRHNVSNGICLCIACHGAHPNFRNNKRCAHGSDEARQAFMDWLEAERQGVFQWLQEHKDDKRKPEKTYKQCYEELKEIKNEA